jgi:hypothetical protein
LKSAVIAIMFAGATLSTVSFAQSDASDRALERYLERLDQRTLLIEHLEQRLSRTTGAERATLAERLTKLVAEELEATSAPSKRAELERRARALLDVIPEGDSIDLRLSLHRATYANAEDVAERWRLRLASAEEVEAAKRVFPALAAELARLGSIANRRVENLERLEEATRSGMDEEEIAEQLADSRRQRSMAMYLSAWCLTYQAELEDARSPALESLARYGWLLNAEPGQAPTIERVPEHILSYEHVARAALGVSASIGIAGDAGLAERWIEMVEDAKGVDPSVLAQAQKRRMLLWARAARWTELNQLVNEIREVNGNIVPLDTVTARLLAVLAFELPAGRAGPAQLALRKTVFTDLIARNEIGQVVDLVGRYGTESLGEAGFITDYVRGLQTYRDASARQQAEGEPDVPTLNPTIRQQYQLAARLLDAALRAPDAGNDPAARADAAMLAALSAYLAAHADPEAMAAAAKRAAHASDLALDDTRKADALWLQVRALRDAREFLGSAAPRETIAAADEAAAQFTQLFPSDPRAGALVLERAAASTEVIPDARTLDALLAIEPGSPSYDAARRRAAAMLFDLASNSSQGSARRDAIRFVEVAGPLMDSDTQATLAGDTARAASAILIARQSMALLLAVRVAESGLAQRAADRLESLVRAGLVSDQAIIAELRYRQLEIALLGNDASNIDAALSALNSLDPALAGPYLDAADRLAYRHAVTLWKAAPEDATRAGQVVHYGVRVLSTLGDNDQTARDPVTISTLMIVSDAAAVLWDKRRDADALQLSRRLIRRALLAQPNAVELLTRSARLASAAGEYADAASTWGTIRAGAEVASMAWFEATTERLTALAISDPALARSELARHFELFSQGGPPPWDTRLAELRASLEGGGS